MMLFKHSSGLSFTRSVNGLTQNHGLYWLLDFIAAQQKRIKKQSRFKVQRWVHKVQFRRATIYCYAGDSDDEPLIFPQGIYSAVTEPVITLYLEDGVLKTQEDRDAPV
jgi:hypothetical protein